MGRRNETSAFCARVAVRGHLRIVCVRLLEVCVSLPVVCSRLLVVSGPLLVDCDRLCSFVVVCDCCLFQ